MNRPRRASRPVLHLIAAVAFSSVAPSLFAADAAVALWAFGPGTLDGVPPRATDLVNPGQAVAAGDRPVRLELIGFPGSDVILAAGAVVRFALETAPGQSAAATLVIQVERGALAADITGSGPYAAVLVRGGALESRATGAEFIIERSADLDYVALAKGLLLVRLRAGLAAADGMALQLQARQGLAGSDKGLSEVDQLNRRPQLGRVQSIQEQATEASSDGEWSHDEAAAACQDPLADGTLTSATADATEPAPLAALPVPQPPTIATAPAPAVATALTTPVAQPPAAARCAPADLTVAQRAAPVPAADLRAAAGARGAAIFLH